MIQILKDVRWFLFTVKFKYFIGNVPQEKVAASNKAFHLILFVNSAAECIKLILQSHSFINDTYWHNTNHQSMKRKYDDCYGLPVHLPDIVVTCTCMFWTKCVCCDPACCLSVFSDILSVHDNDVGEIIIVPGIYIENTK